MAKHLIVAEGLGQEKSVDKCKAMTLCSREEALR
jgi:hypothetical protein